MKRIIILIIAVLMVFAFIGCSNLVGTVSEDDNTPAPAITTNLNQTNSAAAVVINGQYTYFATAHEAWEYANSTTDQDCELVLLKDWIADDEGKFGEGSGYGSTGNLTPVDRDNKNITLTINLNGHTLDRNLKSETKSGNIISLKKDGIYIIKDGTLTGGNTSDRGGAVWIDNNETTVKLENVVITGNHADGNGGGIFIKESSATVHILDTTITDNSSDNYGGGIYAQGRVFSEFKSGPYITMGGIVVINNNTGKSNRNNVTLQSGNHSVYIKDVSGLEEGSEIYIAASAFGSETLVSQVNSKDISGFENYFESDNSELMIIYNDSKLEADRISYD